MTGIAVWSVMRSTPVPQLHGRFTIALPDEAPVEFREYTSLAFSPDGTKLVYVVLRTGVPQLYIRDMEKFEAAPIPGTEGASYPFFSPDGEWIGYFDRLAGRLEKVWVHGGAPVEICEAANGWAASWGVDDTIVFDRFSDGSLCHVSASGGVPQVVASPDREKGEKVLRFPHILPDGKSVLFNIATPTMSSYDDAAIAVLSLQSGERKTLIEGGSMPRYAPTGHIVYARSSSLMTVPFDPETLEVKGAPVSVLEDVATGISTTNPLFGFSQNGTIVYVPGGPDVGLRRLAFVNRRGDVQPIQLEPERYTNVRVSPDGRWLATEVQGVNNQVWLYDLERRTRTRLTSSWDNIRPCWTPDGQRVTYASNRGGGVYELFWKPVDGSGPEERIHSGDYNILPYSWSPDGTQLAYFQRHPTTRDDIWLLTMDGDRRAQPFQVTEFTERGAEFSPDGRWLAYCSNETGRFEVYVRSVSGTGRRVQVSTDGGDQPGWARDGSEIFYRQDEKMMAVAVQTGDGLAVGKPEMLFELEAAVSLQRGATVLHPTDDS